MQLKKIKLAGFKSFVDATTVLIPANLVGVIGPNGCGKSNIIDAVRWVMGESSAKTLRSDSMADVIFSGSTSRKPVGRASVELVFDNSDGSAPGPYAKYAEISIRREVSRDGLSDYFLNKSKCRRKDITDIFLGTGLGPRAYSIIEQGMVTRIIEGKPEDVRVFVEDAAGISKYKDRRRETENRIRHTRENLERVEDIRRELDTQLQRLKRQSRAAARYKEIKQQEQLIHAQLLTLRWQELSAHIGNEDATLSKLETELEAKRAAQREIEAGIERLRQQRITSTDHFNTVQAEFYRLGAKIASVEQAIEHARETYQQRQREREQLDQALGEANRHLEEDRARAIALDRRIEESGPRFEQCNHAWEQATEALAAAEQAMQAWQAAWEEFEHQATQPGKERDVQHARIGQFEQNIKRLKDRQSRLTSESESLAKELQALDLQILQRRADELDRQCEAREASLEEIETRIRRTRKEIDATGLELETVSGRRQAVAARLASLEELQAAAMGQHDKALNTWLEARGLDKAPRLTTAVTVEPGWELAVDRVLGDGAMGAVCVPSLEALAGDVEDLTTSALFVVEQGRTPHEDGQAGRTTLLAKVRSEQADLSALLAGIYAVDGIAEALALRAELAPHEIVVTRSGLLMGGNWLSLVDQEGAKAGVLARARSIERLREESKALDQEVEGLRSQLERSQEVLESLELDHEETRRTSHTLMQDRTGVHNELGRRDAQRTQREARYTQVQAELEELRTQLQRDVAELRTSQQILREAEGQVGHCDERRVQLQAEKTGLLERLERARTTVDEARDARHSEELKHQELRTSLDSARESIVRLEAQQRGFASRRGELDETLAGGHKPEEELKRRLEDLLQTRVKAEARLHEARQTVTDLENEVRDKELGRTEQEQKVQKVRELLEQGRMARKELVVRRETLEDQIRERGFALEQLRAELPEQANEDEWHSQLENLDRKIRRIGPVNLVAIEEYEEQSERKEYLDKQYEDLSLALTTLEDAIRKIDRETRTRFKETYDRINTGFQNFFPRLFGGGHAYLELTADDLLTAGVEVMARPPGKRNSTIHLLSGGEKALTAVALMFSFFDLRPTPFCLLDEVDAPLDDANVERYCETLRAFSQRSQMIYVTHNKISMEAADVLIGVTMSEPGVSALVQVDVVQAMELAAQ